jgi:hypothetical protein
MIRHNGIVIDRKAQSITHRGATWRPQQRRSPARMFRAISMLILGGGVSTHQLFWHVYGDCKDGGPLAGPQIFNVCLCMWLPIFEQLQLEVRKERTAGVSFFRLVPKHVA